MFILHVTFLCIFYLLDMILSELLTALGLNEAQTASVVDAVKGTDEALLSKPLEVIIVGDTPRPLLSEFGSPTTLPDVLDKLRVPLEHQSAIMSALYNDLKSTSEDLLNPSSYLWRMCGDAIKRSKFELSKNAETSKATQTPSCSCQPCKPRAPRCKYCHSHS